MLAELFISYLQKPLLKEPDAVVNTVDIWAKLNHLEPTFCIFEDLVEIPLEQARKMLEEAKAVLKGEK